MKKAGILLEPLYCPEFETFSVLNCKLLLGFFKVSELYWPQFLKIEDKSSDSVRFICFRTSSLWLPLEGSFTEGPYLNQFILLFRLWTKCNLFFLIATTCTILSLTSLKLFTFKKRLNEKQIAGSISETLLCVKSMNVETAFAGHKLRLMMKCQVWQRLNKNFFDV